jgi:hypothetical protein
VEFVTAPWVDLHRLIFGGLVIAIVPSLPGGLVEAAGCARRGR